jgi:hypothetical protein
MPLWKPLQYGYGMAKTEDIHEATFRSKLQLVYKFLSRDVEKAVEVLVTALWLAALISTHRAATGIIWID